MKLWFAFIALLMFAAVVILAAPEDRFLGASYDGYDRGSYIVPSYADNRFYGSVYDGFAICSTTNTSIPMIRHGLVLIIR
ncbi:MAG: hypothetical protein A2283_05070 [Lentisphaerae bacterium RIFOXYA12_FULL_48_11]|nr:MAG: hypothetical protein A2283_05070 [Lentisphaerae bacterium RIFOXYA12_FULL_48_11]